MYKSRNSFSSSLMVEALLLLLEKKEYNSITVKEICEKAGVNRSTFYMYYDTKVALIKAYLSRGCPEGLMFHSDQGTQYIAYTVKQMMRGEGITLLYSNAGCPYDNAIGESFFSTLKKEHIYRYDFRDEWEFKVSIQEYIEFYNGYRPHSTIGYLTPNEAEEAYFANNKVS